jgi:hypothetical protein
MGGDTMMAVRRRKRKALKRRKAMATKVKRRI